MVQGKQPLTMGLFRSIVFCIYIYIYVHIYIYIYVHIIHLLTISKRHCSYLFTIHWIMTIGWSRQVPAFPLSSLFGLAENKDTVRNRATTNISTGQNGQFSKKKTLKITNLRKQKTRMPLCVVIRKLGITIHFGGRRRQPGRIWKRRPKMAVGTMLLVQ